MPASPETPSGVLAVDKDRGWTSHDVVAVCRRALGIRRVGHGGTLDPDATGVLPILVGAATKSAERLHTASKVYGAVVALGRETTTDDASGVTVREAAVPDLPAAELERVLDAFRGEILQVPPAYAAVKVAGRRAYARARAGEQLTLEPRRVTIERLALESWDGESLRLVVVCSTGTYIRALARDIGRAAGSAAHLRVLVRLAVGALVREDAFGIEAVRGADAASLARRLVHVDDRLLALPDRFRQEQASKLLAGWEAR